ncbi:MAG: thermosome subunit [Candidatus Schekmanbacteria bacterium]|nr:MAG: thermosome subunit [Candidatus Schekmanbacteria bacterium]
MINSEDKRFFGDKARRNNILAARVLSETLKTTLGPRGMDKMLVDRTGDVVITNDGATILEEMEVDHPVAKLILDVAKTQEREAGDGTTTAVMIAGKLLENAETLLDKKIHPTIISKGYRMAEEKSQEILEELSVEIESKDELEKVARTAMTGKGVEFLKDHLSKLVVRAAEITGDGRKIDLENIKIEKVKGKSVDKIELVQGLVLSASRATPKMPKKINNAKILLIDGGLEIPNLERETQISVSRAGELRDFYAQEEEFLREIVLKIRSLGVNVVFCSRGIENFVKFALAREGVLAVCSVDSDELSLISRSTGAGIVSKVFDATQKEIGDAGEIEEISNEESSLVFIRECKNPLVATFLVYGSSTHIIDEAKRALKDALGVVASVVKDRKIVAGGGATEIELARRLHAYAKTLGSRESLAVEQFALALESIPIALAENAGIDPFDVLTELRSSHDLDNYTFGINVIENRIEDTLRLGIVEPLRVKLQAISSATEAAITVLRIDDVIAAKKPGETAAKISKMTDYE